MIIMCMTTIKNKVRICPFIYIVCLLLFAACSNEDNAGKDIPSATFSIAPERGQIEGEIQFTNASYGGSGNFTYVWDLGMERLLPKKTRSTCTMRKVYLLLV